MSRPSLAALLESVDVPCEDMLRGEIHCGVARSMSSSGIEGACKMSSSCNIGIRRSVGWVVSEVRRDHCRVLSESMFVESCHWEGNLNETLTW